MLGKKRSGQFFGNAIRIGLSMIFLVLILYSTGPNVPDVLLTADLPLLDISIEQIDNYVRQKEAKLNLKPDNEARIFWVNDGRIEQTEYCLLYIHGFATSWFESNPIHYDFARRYGMNAYMPLLAYNGIVEDEPLIGMTVEGLYESAKEALVIAHLMGKKVIIMGTSTGGTLALKLAADHPDLVDGLIMYSPNIRLRKAGSFLADEPWGLQISRIVQGEKYFMPFPQATEMECQYWNCKYRLEAVIVLERLLSDTMKIETFRRVKTPVFIGYYYKDEENQDAMVRVEAMLWMFDNLGTSVDLKSKMAFPLAGKHEISSQMFSGAWREVEDASFEFAENILRLRPAIYN